MLVNQLLYIFRFFYVKQCSFDCMVQFLVFTLKLNVAVSVFFQCIFGLTDFVFCFTDFVFCWYVISSVSYTVSVWSHKTIHFSSFCILYAIHRQAIRFKSSSFSSWWIHHFIIKFLHLYLHHYNNKINNRIGWHFHFSLLNHVLR